MLKNKSAFITGTNRGIGSALVENFAKNGADIYAHARKPTHEFEEFCRRVSEDNGVNVEPVYFDLSSEDEIITGLSEITSKKIPVDILVNNAGISTAGLMVMTPLSEYRRIFEVNVFAPILITQTLSKSMIRKRSGSIINISSITGFKEYKSRGLSAYAASKAAIINFTLAMALELGPYGIRVNAVAPGFTKTDMTDIKSESIKNATIEETYLGRIGTATEVAETVAFLASDKASFVTGQIIRVDGGRDLNPMF